MTGRNMGGVYFCRKNICETKLHHQGQFLLLSTVFSEKRLDLQHVQYVQVLFEGRLAIYQ